MPEKRKVMKKTIAKKKTVAKKTKKVEKGDKFVCNVCGLVLSVDKVCGCIDACDIICCGKPMKPRKKKYT